MDSTETGETLRDFIRLVTSRHILAFVCGTASILAACLLYYWTLRDTYFPDVSSFVSRTSVLFITLVIFGAAHLIYIRYLRTNLEKEIIHFQSEKWNALQKKVALLEKRLTETKSNGEFLKQRVEELTLASTKGEGTEALGFKKIMPDEKPKLIVQERLFNHEISNKVQIVHGVVSNLLEDPAFQEKQNAQLLRQLQIAMRNLETMSALVKENRDYLIIAS